MKITERKLKIVIFTANYSVGSVKLKRAWGLDNERKDESK